MPARLAVLVLTRDEEHNIGKCLASLAPLGAAIHIVDSGSTDRTVEIARAAGAIVVTRSWTTYGDQFNWGLANSGIDADWVLRMDADEEVTPELVTAITDFLRAPPTDVSGAFVRRRMFFLGRWMRWGGYYPTWLLRLFRHGVGRCEALNMDEHIVLSHGHSVRLHADVIDKNNKDLTFWTNKHNGYATREVMDILGALARQQAGAKDAEVLTASIAPHRQAHGRRWLKAHVYLRLPLFVRPTLYFFYRYVLRLGFLDGREGLVFHFLQGFWYRFLVDAKLLEARQRNATEPVNVMDELRRASAPGSAVESSVNLPRG